MFAPSSNAVGSVRKASFCQDFPGSPSDIGSRTPAAVAETQHDRRVLPAGRLKLLLGEDRVIGRERAKLVPNMPLEYRADRLREGVVSPSGQSVFARISPPSWTNCFSRAPARV